MSGDAGKSRARIELELPPAARRAVEAVTTAGGRAWVVGGAVRDSLLGQRPTDWDLATDLTPEQLLPLFADAASRDARLGAVHLRSESGEVAVHAMREEAGYADHRHPDQVRFVADPERDALRRDFTVNAIYVAADTGAVSDPLGGQRDLRDRLLRAIGEPDVRLAEDPLRMLRAVRFAARAELTIERDTAAALRARAGLLAQLSPERQFAELTDMFTGRHRGRALRLLVDLGLAAVVLPEVPPMDGVPQPPDFHPEGDVLTHVCLVLDHTTPRDAVQAWAAVLHDVGKPPTFERAHDRIRFSGHDVLSAEMADEVLRRMRAPGELRETVTEICRDHIRFAAVPAMKPGKRQRWMRSPRFGAHLAFHRADCLGSHGKLGIWQLAHDEWCALPPEPPPPLCSGRDVLELGVPPGPEVGRILAALTDRLDRLVVPDRDTALGCLREIISARVKRSRPGSR